MLQFPDSGQSVLAEQLRAGTSSEQVPGLGRHTVAALAVVQEMAVSMLHAPVSGQVGAVTSQSWPLLLHLADGQVVVGRHARHSDPVHAVGPEQ